MQKIKLLLVDDHNIVRDGLRALLSGQTEFEIVGEATCGREAVAMAQELRPHVVLMDLAMPLLNGMEATRQITAALPAVKIVILSSYTDVHHLRQALAGGAAAYVLKQAAASDLVQAIFEAHQGRAYFSPAISPLLRQLQVSLDDGAETAAVAPEDQLTRREAEVQQLIAEGFATKQIADQLNLSIKTVERHRSSLMGKLKVHCIAGVVHDAVARGAIELVPVRELLQNS
jgi:DNA-binding NarL/FixJ family response regulator